MNAPLAGTSSWKVAAPIALALATLLVPAAAQGQAADLTAEWGKVSAECGAAYKVVTAPRDENPAADRLAALERYRACLAMARSRSAAPRAAGDEKGRDLRGLVLDEATVAAEERRADAALAGARADTAFLGISFGVGVGVSIAADDVVSEAEVGADGTIRATKRAKELPRVILESHYYGWCRSASCRAGTFGWGPYFGIVAKSDKLISAFSLGLMLGWKEAGVPESQGFSIGVGAILDDGVTSLARGFKAGKPLPPGETSVRYEEKARWGGLLFCARTF